MIDAARKRNWTAQSLQRQTVALAEKLGKLLGRERRSTRPVSNSEAIHLALQEALDLRRGRKGGA
jgi:hypothetical protein